MVGQVFLMNHSFEQVGTPLFFPKDRKWSPGRSGKQVRTR